MNTTLAPTAHPDEDVLELIDQRFIETGLSHLLEENWFNDETGNMHFELEDTRCVIITPGGSVTIVDALDEE